MSLSKRFQRRSIDSGSRELNYIVFRYVKSVEEQGKQSELHVFKELNREWRATCDKLNRRLIKNGYTNAVNYKAFEHAIKDKKYMRQVRIALGYYTPFDVKLKNYFNNIFKKSAKV